MSRFKKHMTSFFYINFVVYLLIIGTAKVHNYSISKGLFIPLSEKQVAEHQFRRISIFQKNHEMGVLTIPIHHHYLTCLFCFRLVKKQIIEHS